MSQIQTFGPATGGIPVGGPGLSTDHAFARWDGTTGDLLEDSTVISDDAGNVTGILALTITGKGTFGAGQVVSSTVPGAYPYTVLATDYVVLVDTSIARTINLPNAPTTNTVYVIKDNVGSAAANNITLTTVGGVVTIDGATSQTISNNWGSLKVIFNGTSYRII